MDSLFDKNGFGLRVVFYFFYLCFYRFYFWRLVFE